jgi:hypothetical protein
MTITTEVYMRIWDGSHGVHLRLSPCPDVPELIEVEWVEPDEDKPYARFRLSSDHAAAVAAALAEMAGRVRG